MSAKIAKLEIDASLPTHTSPPMHSSSLHATREHHTLTSGESCLACHRCWEHSTSGEASRSMPLGHITAWRQHLFWRRPPPAARTPRMAPPTPLMCLPWSGPYSCGFFGPASMAPLPQVTLPFLLPCSFIQISVFLERDRPSVTGECLVYIFGSVHGACAWDCSSLWHHT